MWILNFHPIISCIINHPVIKIIRSGVKAVSVVIFFSAVQTTAKTPWLSVPPWLFFLHELRK